ncbi:MAG: hypothetical protein NT034_00365 [Candidatus Magasanikbacteria bacterium]|nr:hypothetical protein [Candidatus Magasanikbacteria bacterium]
MSINLINLLPERKKEGLEKLIKFLFCKEILEVILLVCAFLSMTLLWGWIILEDHFSALSQSALSVNREFSHYNQEVRKINFAIKTLNIESAGFTPLTPKVLDIINKLPSDIKLNSLDINRSSGTFQISGIAKTRDALLNLQSLLEKIDWLDHLESPTSQLFQKQDISFDIKAKIKNIPLLEPEINKPKNTGGNE